MHVILNYWRILMYTHFVPIQWIHFSFDLGEYISISKCVRVRVQYLVWMKFRRQLSNAFYSIFYCQRLCVVDVAMWRLNSPFFWWI